MSPASFKLKERFHAENEETFTIRSMLSYLFKNKYLLIYYIGIFFYNSLSIGNAFGLFVSYYLFHSALFSIIVGAVGTIPQLVISLLLPKLIRKYDKMKVNRICLLLYVILSVIIWVIGYDNAMLYIVLFTIRSIPLAVVALEMFMFTPDCAEYGKFKSGIEAKGITFAIQTFAVKLAAAISGSLGLALLGVFGFKTFEGVDSFEALEAINARAQQTPEAIDGLWFTYNVIPIIGLVIALVIWNFYKLNDKDVQVMIDCNTGKITREEAFNRMSKKYDIDK